MRLEGPEFVGGPDANSSRLVRISLQMALTPPDPFAGVNWEDLHKRLLVLAVRLFTLAGLGGRDAVMVGVGCSPADLVQGTITKAIAGDGIRFQAAKGQLLPFLRTAMINDFRDMRRKSSHRTTNRVNHTADEEGTEQNGKTLDGFLDGSSLTAEGTTIFFMDIKKAVGPDPKLIEYVEAYEIGCDKPADVAAVCNADIADIYQRRRKLEKRLAAKVTP